MQQHGTEGVGVTGTAAPELTRESIEIGRELLIIEEGINAYLETWFDVDEKFGLQTADNPDQIVNFYATYHPEKDALNCTYIISDENDDIVREYTPTPNEAALIKAMMEVSCRTEHACGLLELWNERDAGNG